MTIPTASQLDFFHPAIQRWFAASFTAPTTAQLAAWPAITAGRNVLLLAPTGSGKTLAAFLCAIHRIMFPDTIAKPELRPSGIPANAASSRRDLSVAGTRVLYITPIKALGVDIRAQLPPHTDCRSSGCCFTRRVWIPRTADCDPQRRYDTGRPQPDQAAASGHSDYDSGVSLSHADIAKSGDSASRRDGYRR